MKLVLRSLWANEDGAEIIEWVIVAAMLVGVAAGGYQLLGANMENAINGISNKLSSGISPQRSLEDLVAAMRSYSKGKVEDMLAIYRGETDRSLQASHARWVRGFNRDGTDWQHDGALVIQEVLDERGLTATGGRIEPQ